MKCCKLEKKCLDNFVVFIWQQSFESQYSTLNNVRKKNALKIERNICRRSSKSQAANFFIADALL
jgi:hypothetical protein